MSLQIDYQNEILYGVLGRMAPSAGEVKPILEEYWVCGIDPKKTPKILELIKTQFQYTTENLRHLKRMYKSTDKFGNTSLKVIICPVESNQNQYSSDELMKILKETTKQDDIILEKREIPINKPFDKETNMKWSKDYWPLLWKGNPLVQDLNEIYKNIDIDKIHHYMDKIVQLSKDCDSNYPIVTIFVDPSKDEVRSIRYDERTPSNPIKHSILDGIAEIAAAELERRQKRKIQDVKANNYLCLNYHVYTTHEPCTMCAMALVHSRISRLVYLKRSPQTGGIGKTSGHCEMIHLSCALNWKFEAFQYLDQEKVAEIDDIDPVVFV